VEPRAGGVTGCLSGLGGNSPPRIEAHHWLPDSPSGPDSALWPSNALCKSHHLQAHVLMSLYNRHSTGRGLADLRRLTPGTPIEAKAVAELLADMRGEPVGRIVATRASLTRYCARVEAAQPIGGLADLGGNQFCT